MPKRQLAVWLVSALAVLPAVVGTAEVAPSSVAYLQAQPQNSWITMALVAAGVANPPLDHLRTVSGTTSNEYAKTILAVAAVGQNPATFGNIDYVAKLKSFSTSGQIGDPNFLSDDAWGILALAASGVPVNATEVTAAANFLRTHQNSDGGWPFAVGGSSDTNSTAVAIMALRESGISASDPALVAAVAYLRAAQNADGGFPYDAGGESDADSTSWVTWAIRKLGQDPSSWKSGGNAPLEFLATLANPDGSYSWMASSPGANPFATQDAVLALAGATMPVGYFRTAATGGYAFRIEGREHTLCSTRVDGETAYDLLVAAQTPCAYTFSGQTFTGLGFLLTQINDEAAEGFASWMYLVNNAPASVGLQGYQLQPSDEIFIYLDPDNRTPVYPDYDRPLELTLAASAIASGQTVTATVTTWRDGTWVPLDGATVSGAGSAAVTAADGTAVLTPADGVNQVIAGKPDFIRSLVQELVVGSGVPGAVGLVAEVASPSSGGGPGGGSVGGSSIVFTVEPTALDFGTLLAGERAVRTLQLRNGGTVNLDISAQVSGDSLFSSLRIDGAASGVFGKSLPTATVASTTVELPVPAGYLGRGVKTGQLIFWAEGE